MVQLSTTKICLVALLQWFRQHRLLVVKHNAITLCASVLTTSTDWNGGSRSGAYVPRKMEKLGSKDRGRGPAGPTAGVTPSSRRNDWRRRAMAGAKDVLNGKISLRRPKARGDGDPPSSTSTPPGFPSPLTGGTTPPFRSFDSPLLVRNC